MAILIIEDEKNMSDLLKLELTHAGYCCIKLMMVKLG